MSVLTLTDQIASIALILSVISVAMSISQTRISRRTFERDTLLKVQEHAISNEIANKFELIASLNPYATYEEFVKEVAEEDIKKIQQVVAHLNYCAQLVHEGYLKKQLVWNRYFWMYRICNEKLIPWWLQHHQSLHPNRFSNFKNMCTSVAQITESEIDAFDSKTISD